MVGHRRCYPKFSGGKSCHFAQRSNYKFGMVSRFGSGNDANRQFTIFMFLVNNRPFCCIVFCFAWRDQDYQ